MTDRLSSYELLHVRQQPARLLSESWQFNHMIGEQDGARMTRRRFY